MASGSLELRVLTPVLGALLAGLAGASWCPPASAEDPGSSTAATGSRLRNCPDCPPHPLLIDCAQGQAAAGWIVGSGEAAAFSLSGWTQRLELDATLAGAQALIGIRWRAPDGTRSARATFRVKRGEPFLPWTSPAQVPAGYGAGELRCTWAE